MLIQNINFTFANKATARHLITTEDEYLRNMSTYDYGIRHIDPPTREKYIELAADSVGDFTPEEEENLVKALNIISLQLERQGLQLPSIDEITIVKTNTDMYECGAAGFTRGKTIFIDNFDYHHLLGYESYADYLAILIAHELFHVLSRNCSDFKKMMYNVIGFNILEKEIPVPKLHNLAFFSNPDVVRHDSFVEVTINRKKERCAIMTYGDFPLHTHMNMFFIIRPFLLVLNADNQPDGTFFSIYEDKKIRTKMKKIMGKDNDYYLNDPEECLAEHFALAVLNEKKKDDTIMNGIRELLHSASTPPSPSKLTA